ncbi:MAG: hypothetical protein K8J31_13355 [Anaerolineae bacterium]|nr:hypothetical protein [Anaerolineae bacterium]
MQPETETVRHYQARITQLEVELDEMTVALSQAWDQLVPFLQEVPPQADSQTAILPIIQAALAAVDADLGASICFRKRNGSPCLPGPHCRPFSVT